MMEAFNLFDTDSNGGIATSQIPTVLRAVGFSPTELECRKMVASVNQAQGIVKFDDFLPIAEQAHAAHKNNKTNVSADIKGLEKGMQVFFKEKGTKVSIKNLRHCLCAVGEKLSDDEWKDLQKELPVEDGMVEFSAFMNLIGA
jgi:calcium-binding protein CML